jgi:hypothetical protein
VARPTLHGRVLTGTALLQGAKHLWVRACWLIIGCESPLGGSPSRGVTGTAILEVQRPGRARRACVLGTALNACHAALASKIDPSEAWCAPALKEWVKRFLEPGLKALYMVGRVASAAEKDLVLIPDCRAAVRASNANRAPPHLL